MEHPLPYCYLNIWGEHGFNKVPVIVTQYSINLQQDVDYIPVVTSVGWRRQRRSYLCSNKIRDINNT